MIVKKKNVKFEEDNNPKGSSLMVSRSDEEDKDYEGSDSEEELYNLMRGHTSLMITEESDSDSEADQESR